MQSILGPLEGLLTGPPPYATLGILGISIILAIITSLANKRLLDIPRLRRITAEVQAWSSDYFKAQRAKDTKALEKLGKKKEYVDKLRAEMMSQQFKPTLFFAVPLLVLFYVLSGLYGTQVAAWLPFYPLPPFDGMAICSATPPFTCYAPFYLWYLICSIACYQIIQRLLGASLTVE